MNHHDTCLRFLIDNSAIRGEWVLLESTYQSVISRHNYPMELETLIGQLMAAAVMLSSTIKYEGMMIIQAQGGSPVRLLSVECTHDKELRAIARWEGDLSGLSFSELLAGAQLSITIDPAKGERYQGIVPLHGDSLAQCLEHYFEQSEQLPTRIWLNEGSGRAAGLLLQIMPFNSKSSQDQHKTKEDWNRLTTLADTLTTEEHLSLEPEQLLYRLFHEEQVRLFERCPVSFKCRCSRERFAEAIIALGRQEIDSILEDSGNIVINCEYCNKTYLFDEVDIGAMMAENAPDSPQQHH